MCVYFANGFGLLHLSLYVMKMSFCFFNDTRAVLTDQICSLVSAAAIFCCIRPAAFVWWYCSLQSCFLLYLALSKTSFHQSFQLPIPIFYTSCTQDHIDICFLLFSPFLLFFVFVCY